ncbi:MAG: TolC family protein [bacterium]
MSKMFKLTVGLVFLIVSSISATYAQNGQALSLEECINLAMKNNSELRTAVYEVDRAGAGVKGSYSGVLPRITTSFQTGRFIQGDRTLLMDVPVGFDSTTNTAIFEQTEINQPGAARNSHFARITYSQTLYDFGRSWNAIKQANASYNAWSDNLTSVRHSVYSIVKQRYFELLKAEKLEQEYIEAVERSKEQLKRTQSMYEIGSVAQIDVYKAEVVLATDEINLINQRNIVEIARGNLNVAMGRDPETPIQIIEVETDVKPVRHSLDEAISIAEQNNPDLRRFKNEMNSSEYGMKIAKAAYWPSIGFSVSYSRNNTALNKVYGELGKNFSVTVGAQLDFSIFNGMADRAEVDRQSANYSIAKENWLNRKRNIRLEVKQAYLNLKAWQEISKINERSLRAAEEDFRLAQERYRVGAGTLLEVTDAQVALTRARVTLVSAKYNAMIAQAQLEVAMGMVENEQF